jgi:hypothetical protein
MDDIDGMARAAQDRRQAVGQRDIVFGEHDAHGCFPCFSKEITEVKEGCHSDFEI